MSVPKKYPVSVQLYSVREEIKQLGYAEVLKKIAAIGYDAVEFAGFYGQKPKEIKRKLDDLGLKASSSHGAIPDKDNIDQIIDDAKELGYEWHITGLGPEAFADEDACKKSAEILREGTSVLEKEGIKLGYHNHWWEFEKQIKDKYPLQIILDCVPDLNWLVVELDFCATDMLAAVRKSFDYLVDSGFGEAPRGTCPAVVGRRRRKPRGNLLRRSSLFGCAGRVFAEPCEAKNAIAPCGKPQGFLAKKGQTSTGKL